MPSASAADRQVVELVAERDAVDQPAALADGLLKMYTPSPSPLRLKPVWTWPPTILLSAVEDHVRAGERIEPAGKTYLSGLAGSSVTLMPERSTVVVAVVVQLDQVGERAAVAQVGVVDRQHLVDADARARSSTVHVRDDVGDGLGLPLAGVVLADRPGRCRCRRRGR